MALSELRIQFQCASICGSFGAMQTMSTPDFFRSRLDSMIDLRNPLTVLGSRMPWDEIEVALAPVFAHKERDGRVVEEADLFGTTTALAGDGVSDAGRPRLPIRLM